MKQHSSNFLYIPLLLFLLVCFYINLSWSALSNILSKILALINSVQSLWVFFLCSSLGCCFPVFCFSWGLLLAAVVFLLSLFQFSFSIQPKKKSGLLKQIINPKCTLTKHQKIKKILQCSFFKMRDQHFSNFHFRLYALN